MTHSPVEQELFRRIREAHEPVEDGAEGQCDEQDIRQLGDRVPNGV